MMMKLRMTIFVSLLLALAAVFTSAQDEMPWFQSADFNVPVLQGWDDQSADGAAIFNLASAQATIRTAMATGSDVESVAVNDVSNWLGARLGEAVYSGKVNLADGTWLSQAYDVDDQRSVSIMARQAGDRVIVISFLERDPSARTLMLTIAQADDSLDKPAPEIDSALQTVTPLRLDDLQDAGIVSMPGGEWTLYEGVSAQAAGSVFGNDSYIALREGAPGDLATLADAWQRTALGFFITPDNSLYLALGLAASFAILALLVGSFIWRERSLQKDLDMLAQLESA